MPLTNINLPNFDTQNINLSNFNTQNATNINDIYEEQKIQRQLDICDPFPCGICCDACNRKDRFIQKQQINSYINT